jgi:L-asparaginase/Glu-tRNA(Gln) amidotransferase subunit D
MPPDEAAAAPTRRVAVIGLGGTIAMVPGEGDGVVPTLTAEQLVAAVPGLPLRASSSWSTTSGSSPARRCRLLI